MVDGFARIAEMRKELASLQAEVAEIVATIHQDVAHLLLCFVSLQVDLPTVWHGLGR